MTQYQIYWAKLPPPIGRRPVLLLSRPAAYKYLHRVIVAEVTTTIRGIPQELRLGKREGLTFASVANFDNLHLVDKDKLESLIGTLAKDRHLEVNSAVGHALGWPELITL
jgi:mRNA interferase MazF